MVLKKSRHIFCVNSQNNIKKMFKIKPLLTFSYSFCSLKNFYYLKFTFSYLCKKKCADLKMGSYLSKKKKLQKNKFLHRLILCLPISGTRFHIYAFYIMLRENSTY